MLFDLFDCQQLLEQFKPIACLVKSLVFWGVLLLSVAFAGWQVEVSKGEPPHFSPEEVGGWWHQWWRLCPDGLIPPCCYSVHSWFRPHDCEPNRSELCEHCCFGFVTYKMTSFSLPSWRHNLRLEMFTSRGLQSSIQLVPEVVSMGSDTCFVIGCWLVVFLTNETRFWLEPCVRWTLFWS